jgi:hypothetical protein
MSMRKPASTVSLLAFVLALRIASFIDWSSISMLVRIVHPYLCDMMFYMYRRGAFRRPPHGNKFHNRILELKRAANPGVTFSA